MNMSNNFASPHRFAQLPQIHNLTSTSTVSVPARSRFDPDRLILTVPPLLLDLPLAFPPLLVLALMLWIASLWVVPPVAADRPHCQIGTPGEGGREGDGMTLCREYFMLFSLCGVQLKL